MPSKLTESKGQLKAKTIKDGKFNQKYWIYEERLPFSMLARKNFTSQ